MAEIPIIGQQDAPRGQHIVDAVDGRAGGEADLGAAINTMKRGRELGRQIQASLVTPRDVSHLTVEFSGELDAVVAHLREQNPGRDIGVEATFEGFIGCVICHWTAHVDTMTFHTEEVTMIGTQPRPENDWPKAYAAVYEFISMALVLEPSSG